MIGTVKTLGDRCKWYEKNFSPETMIPLLPVIIRIDGNNFSKWTKKLERPVDLRLVKLMVNLTKELVKVTNAKIGYSQSDEITLILWTNDWKKPIYHAGEKQKILSKLTGIVVNYFNSNRPTFIPENEQLANFDMRIYQVPTFREATAQLLWRERDATKNSIQSLAHSQFSNSELFGLNTDQLQDKLMLEKGINWNDCPIYQKRGVYVKTVTVTRPITEEFLATLPPQHNLVTGNATHLTRKEQRVLQLPIITKVDDIERVVFTDYEACSRFSTPQDKCYYYGDDIIDPS